MTDDRMALLEALQKADDGNFLRALADAVLLILMEADVEGLIGAGRDERTTWRNGYRDRALETRLGQLNLRIPKLRCGSRSWRRPVSGTSRGGGQGIGLVRPPTGDAALFVARRRAPLLSPIG